MENNYSQRFVGQVLSISQPAYKNIESGRTFVNACQLALLADFYRVPIHFFYDKDTPCYTEYRKKQSQQEQQERQPHKTEELLALYQRRIAELEAKVLRKDAKIEALLGDSTPL